MHTVVEMPQFIRSKKAYGISEQELETIVTHFARNPTDGNVIPRTGGARKKRFGGRGKGTSGGYRVVSFYSGLGIPVFLLDVFAKGDRIDLTQSERNELKKVLNTLVETYKGRPR